MFANKFHFINKNSLALIKTLSLGINVAGCFKSIFRCSGDKPISQLKPVLEKDRSAD
jgi:hypothetical protein